MYTTVVDNILANILQNSIILSTAGHNGRQRSTGGAILLGSCTCILHFTQHQYTCCRSGRACTLCSFAAQTLNVRLSNWLLIRQSSCFGKATVMVCASLLWVLQGSSKMQCAACLAVPGDTVPLGCLCPGLPTGSDCVVQKTSAA